MHVCNVLYCPSLMNEFRFYINQTALCGQLIDQLLI